MITVIDLFSLAFHIEGDFPHQSNLVIAIALLAVSYTRTRLVYEREGSERTRQSTYRKRTLLPDCLELR